MMQSIYRKTKEKPVGWPSFTGVESGYVFAPASFCALDSLQRRTSHNLFHTFRHRQRFKPHLCNGHVDHRHMQPKRAIPRARKEKIFR